MTAELRTDKLAIFTGASVERSPDDRSAIAAAFAWSTQITTVALEMVLPAAIGYWLDQRLGTVVVFVILGAILGMAASLTHLLQMTSPKKGERGRSGDRQEGRRIDHDDQS